MGSLLIGLAGRLRATGTGLRVVVLVMLAAGAGLLAGEDAAAEAREYSAYSDPGKTALSFVLSSEENVRSLREEFGLEDAEVERILAAVRKENEKLANAYAESERILAANESLPDAEVARKVADSDYDETVTGAISATKDTVAGLLPEGGGPELESWVDERWRREVESASGESFGRVVETRDGGRALRCKVFATQYRGHTRYEAALPHRALKFGSQPRVAIDRVHGGGPTVRPRIKEVGPWNTRDNYWRSGKKRAMWRDLPRCLPEAQAAYYRNYNRGKDEYGREVLNPAGADLTPAVARRMGLRKYDNAWVYVRFPWVRR